MALPRKLRSVLPLLAVLALVLAVCLHFCLWKSGMFIDEIYTYGLANSHFMPFIGHGEHDRIQEQIITREDFFDYLAVTDSEPGFDAASVYYNQVQDVHPPLYYWILNFCSTLARGQFSKWIGLIPDLLIYLGLLLLLYALGMELFENRLIAAGIAALYGFSQVGLSTMLMIRMYVLMTLFTVLLALLVVRELRTPSGKKELGIGLTIFAGLMTQYYFVFYAFFDVIVLSGGVYPDDGTSPRTGERRAGESEERFCLGRPAALLLWAVPSRDSDRDSVRCHRFLSLADPGSGPERTTHHEI